MTLVLDAKIQKVKEYFGCQSLEDWRSVRPEWVLALDGVGKVTLDHIRLYLAERDITLADDKTPAYWKSLLGSVRAGQVMASDECSIIVPFTILVDSQEQRPFGFYGIVADVRDWTTDIRWRINQGLMEPDEVRLVVPTEFRSLGVAMGDYSIDGCEGLCHVERKSLDDAHGTILGWGERRERFERELSTLSQLDNAAVVVEASLGELLSHAPARGKKSEAENRKTLHRQVIAWTQDYRVPWLFCDSRRMAEITTFRILQRFWRKRQQAKLGAVDAAEKILTTL